MDIFKGKIITRWQY